MLLVKTLFTLVRAGGWSRFFASSVRASSASPVAAPFVRALAATALMAILAITPWSQSAAREPVRSLLEMRRSNVVIQEWDLSCGAAALTTILNYRFGDPVSEKEIARALINRQEYIDNPRLVQIRQGFSLLDLKRVVEGRGYLGVGLGRMNVEDLVARAPVMVPIVANGYNHFVIFRGTMGDRVLIADPAFGNYTMRIDKFEDAWIDYADFGKVAFVVTRRDGDGGDAGGDGGGGAVLNGLAPRANDFVMFR